MLQSISCSDIGKCLSLEVHRAPTDTDMPYAVYTGACCIHWFVSADEFTGMPFTALHPGWMESDVFLYLLPILFACILSTSSNCLFSIFEKSRVYLLQNELRGEKTARMLSGVAQIHLILLIYGLISGYIALQRALLMMQVSTRSLPVCVTVLIFSFTFELQSKSGANMLLVSGHLCTFGFGSA